MEEEKKEIKRMPAFCRIVICEAVVISLILLSVITLKYFFKPEFKKAQDFYKKYFLNDTSVSEVLKK
mgnify:FL=1